MGNELRSAVGRDMSENSVFLKHMDYKELGNVDVIESWVAMKIACFISRSTITNIEVYPEEDGN